MVKVFTKDYADNKKIKINVKDYIYDPSKIKKFIDEIKYIAKISNSIQIYDITQGYCHGKIIDVIDHVNKTGNNPLVGYQKYLGIDFPDISDLYNNGEKGIITTCRGNNFYNNNIKNSSTWICHVSILARAVGIKHIYGKLYSI